jgi:hypothetical protein
MISSGLKLLVLSLWLGGLLASPVFAAEEKPWTEQLKGDLSDIKARLASIEERQKEIIAKEGEIFKELERVRIWVHRK